MRNGSLVYGSTGVINNKKTSRIKSLMIVREVESYWFIITCVQVFRFWILWFSRCYFLKLLIYFLCCSFQLMTWQQVPCVWMTGLKLLSVRSSVPMRTCCPGFQQVSLLYRHFPVTSVEMLTC